MRNTFEIRVHEIDRIILEKRNAESRNSFRACWQIEVYDNWTVVFKEFFSWTADDGEKCSDTGECQFFSSRELARIFYREQLAAGFRLVQQGKRN